MASEAIVIRHATGDDLHGVMRVGELTWPPTYGPIAGDDYVAMGLAKWWTAEATIPAIRAGRVTVAQLGDEIVGVAAVGPLDGHLALWKLYVLPGHQGAGIGTRLMSAVLDDARRHGYDEVRLSYLDGNTHAAKFYARNGFEEFDRDTSGSGVPDSIWVKLQLDAAPENEENA